MKAIVSHLSLLLAVLPLTGALRIPSVEAQASSPETLPSREHQPLAQTDSTPSETLLEGVRGRRIVEQIEQTWEQQYEEYFQQNFSDESTTAQEVAQTLERLAIATGKKSALIYIIPRPDRLEVVAIPPGSPPIYKRIQGVTPEALQQTAVELRKTITDPTQLHRQSYLPAAQQLYQWMVMPIEAELAAQDIDTLIFCTGAGLRAMPLAALHDGQQFLIEKYSLGQIPAFKFTQTRYSPLKNAQVLAMGASEFPLQNPLPAVPVELSTIAENLWSGKSFLNQEFTLNNLQQQRRQQSFEIVHLATHADFQAGKPNQSYIQFWDTQVTLDEMEQLPLSNPAVELLVLSACRTAIGDTEAELGFAGLAVQAGVNSAVASLWYVSDAGTLGLMSEFYRHLQTAPIKAEALRQAQLAMLSGEVRLSEGQLQTSRGNIPLPPDLAELQSANWSHPYYWAAFSVIGSPW
jgi:CHAT domain-containing protein